MFAGINFQINNLDHVSGSTSGGYKLRQHYSSYLFRKFKSADNCENINSSKTFPQEFIIYLYIFTIASTLHPSSNSIPQNKQTTNNHEVRTRLSITEWRRKLRCGVAMEVLEISQVIQRKRFTPYLCDSKTPAPTQCCLAFIRPSLLQCTDYSIYRNHFLKIIPTDNVRNVQGSPSFWNPAWEKLRLTINLRGYAFVTAPDIANARFLNIWIFNLLSGSEFLCLVTLLRSLLSPHFHFKQSFISKGSVRSLLKDFFRGPETYTCQVVQGWPKAALRNLSVDRRYEEQANTGPSALWCTDPFFTSALPRGYSATVLTLAEH